MVKLVVSDLDGTLLNKDGKVEKDILNIIKRLNDNGILFTIATGRSISMAKKILELLNIEIPYILCNGAVVAHQKKVVIKKTMPLKLFREVLEKAVKLDMTVIYSVDGIDYLLEETYWSLHRKEDYLENIELHRLEDDEWDSMEIDKVFILNDKDNEEINFIREDESIIENCSLTQYGNQSLEIVKKGVSKSSGIEYLASSLNIDFSNVLAIGDQFNDVEMIKDVGYGIAVGNANEDIKKYANYVTQDEYYLGVIEAINKFCF